jgi:ABC-type dipeptide/oligopeptide/nickel transport system permease component
MTTYLIKRLLGTVPILLLVTVVVFAIMQILPGDPARMILGQEATPQALEALRERLGLNRPLHVQYLVWVGNVLRATWAARWWTTRRSRVRSPTPCRSRCRSRCWRC